MSGMAGENKPALSDEQLVRSSSAFSSLLHFFHVFSRNLNLPSFTADEFERALIDPHSNTLFIDVMWSLCFERKKTKSPNESLKRQKELNLDGWKQLFREIIQTAQEPGKETKDLTDPSAAAATLTSAPSNANSAATHPSPSAPASAVDPPSCASLKAAAAAAKRAAVATAAQSTFDSNSLINSLHPTHTVFSRIASLFVDGIHPFNDKEISVADIPLADRLLVLEWLMEYKLNDQPESFMTDIRRGEVDASDEAERVRLADRMRAMPIGRDQKGHSYYQLTDDCDCWIFRERTGDQPAWSLDQEYGFIDSQTDEEEEEEEKDDGQTSDDEDDAIDVKKKSPAKSNRSKKRNSMSSTTKCKKESNPPPPSASKKRRRSVSDKSSSSNSDSDDAPEEDDDDESTQRSQPQRKSRNSRSTTSAELKSEPVAKNANAKKKPKRESPSSASKSNARAAAAAPPPKTPSKRAAASSSSRTPAATPTHAPEHDASLEQFLTPKAIAMQQRAMAQVARLAEVHRIQQLQEQQERDARRAREGTSSDDDDDDEEEDEDESGDGAGDGSDSSDSAPVKSTPKQRGRPPKSASKKRTNNKSNKTKREQNNEEEEEEEEKEDDDEEEEEDTKSTKQSNNKTAKKETSAPSSTDLTPSPKKESSAISADAAAGDSTPAPSSASGSPVKVELPVSTSTGAALDTASADSGSTNKAATGLDADADAAVDMEDVEGDHQPATGDSAAVKVKDEPIDTSADPAIDSKAASSAASPSSPKLAPVVPSTSFVCPSLPVADRAVNSFGYRLLRPQQRFVWEVVSTNLTSLKEFLELRLPESLLTEGTKMMARNMSQEHKLLMEAIEKIIASASATEDARARNLERRMRAQYQPKKRSSRIESLQLRREQEELEEAERRAAEEAEERARQKELRREREEEKAKHRILMRTRIEQLEERLKAMQEEHATLEAEEAKETAFIQAEAAAAAAAATAAQPVDPTLHAPADAPMAIATDGTPVVSATPTPSPSPAAPAPSPSLVAAPRLDAIVHGHRLRLLRLERVSRQLAWRVGQEARRLTRDGKYTGTGAGRGEDGQDRTDDEAPAYSESSDEEQALAKLAREAEKERRRNARNSVEADDEAANGEDESADELRSSDDEEVEITGWDELAIEHQIKTFLNTYVQREARREQRRKDGLDSDTPDEEEEKPSNATPQPDSNGDVLMSDVLSDPDLSDVPRMRTLRARSPLGRMFLRNSLPRGIEEPGLFFRIRRKKWAAILETVQRAKARERALKVLEKKKRHEERRARGEPSESESEEEVAPPTPTLAPTPTPMQTPQPKRSIAVAATVAAAAGSPIPAVSSSPLRKSTSASKRTPAVPLTPEQQAAADQAALELKRQKQREGRLRRKAAKIAQHEQAMADAKQRNGGVTPPPGHPLYVKPLVTRKSTAASGQHAPATNDESDDDHDAHDSITPHGAIAHMHAQQQHQFHLQQQQQQQQQHVYPHMAGQVPPPPPPPVQQFAEPDPAAVARYQQALVGYESELAKYNALLPSATLTDPVTGLKLPHPILPDGSILKRPRKPSRPARKSIAGTATPPRSTGKAKAAAAVTAAPTAAALEPNVTFTNMHQTSPLQQARTQEDLFRFQQYQQQMQQQQQQQQQHRQQPPHPQVPPPGSIMTDATGMMNDQRMQFMMRQQQQMRQQQEQQHMRQRMQQHQQHQPQSQSHQPDDPSSLNYPYPSQFPPPSTHASGSSNLASSMDVAAFLQQHKGVGAGPGVGVGVGGGNYSGGNVGAPPPAPYGPPLSSNGITGASLNPNNGMYSSFPPPPGMDPSANNTIGSTNPTGQNFGNPNLFNTQPPQQPHQHQHQPKGQPPQQPNMHSPMHGPIMTPEQMQQQYQIMQQQQQQQQQPQHQSQQQQQPPRPAPHPHQQHHSPPLQLNSLQPSGSLNYMPPPPVGMHVNPNNSNSATSTMPSNTPLYTNNMGGPTGIPPNPMQTNNGIRANNQTSTPTGGVLTQAEMEERMLNHRYQLMQQQQQQQQQHHQSHHPASHQLHPHLPVHSGVGGPYPPLSSVPPSSMPPQHQSQPQQRSPHFAPAAPNTIADSMQHHQAQLQALQAQQARLQKQLAQMQAAGTAPPSDVQPFAITNMHMQQQQQQQQSHAPIGMHATTSQLHHATHPTLTEPPSTHAAPTEQN